MSKSHVDNGRMGFLEYIRFFLAFGFVLGLIGVLYWGVRRYGLERFGLSPGARSSGPRLRVQEVRALDGRRRLVLVRRDDVEHLIVVGGESDMVVERGIPVVHGRPPEPMTEAEST